MYLVLGHKTPSRKTPPGRRHLAIRKPPPKKQHDNTSTFSKVDKSVHVAPRFQGARMCQDQALEAEHSGLRVSGVVFSIMPGV